MEAIHSQLVVARDLFYSWRLVEAYAVLRRYFDRIPFKPEPEHAEYIGIFVRTLAEIGKQDELHFYLAELEKHHLKESSPCIAYQLAIISIHLREPNFKNAISLLTPLLSDPDVNLQTKAKMALAHCYASSEQTEKCRPLIDSIHPPSDPPLLHLYWIWQAHVFRYEKQYLLAQQKVLQILEVVTEKEDWYAFFSAKLLEILLALDLHELQKARVTLEHLRAIFHGRNFKTVQIHLKEVEYKILELSDHQKVTLIEHSEGYLLQCQNGSLSLNHTNQLERLLIELAKKGFLSKKEIIETFHQRPYHPSDDGRIYSIIHSLRKKLYEHLGHRAILNESPGYRFCPAVTLETRRSTC